MMRKCHLNTCPVGVATQDPECRKRFAGEPEHLVRYFHFVAEELRGIMARLGCRTVEEMVGKSHLLVARVDGARSKARSLDFGAVLAPPEAGAEVATRCAATQDHGIDDVLDRTLIADCAAALERGEAVALSYSIHNVDRATGTMLSGEIARRHGGAGLPADTIQLRFQGSAGQSFGAFAAPGLTLTLEGDANDYLGKGLSGGRIVVRPPEGSRFEAASNVIVGNTVLYGATGGEAFFNGLAGERFAVRNSGARVVVEGVGDHGCEYMTGGVVVVLGPTGVNFAAGMSGGVAFVYDPRQEFDLRCNLGLVDLEPVTEDEDVSTLRELIAAHQAHTGSALAAEMLAFWDRELPLFVKVMPVEYRRALGRIAEQERNARRTEAEDIKHA